MAILFSQRLYFLLQDVIVDDSGMRAAFPNDFDAMANNQDARRRRRERMKPTQEVAVLPKFCLPNYTGIIRST